MTTENQFLTTELNRFLHSTENQAKVESGENKIPMFMDLGFDLTKFGVMEIISKAIVHWVDRREVINQSFLFKWFYDLKWGVPTRDAITFIIHFYNMVLKERI